MTPDKSAPSDKGSEGRVVEVVGREVGTREGERRKEREGERGGGGREEEEEEVVGVGGGRGGEERRMRVLVLGWTGAWSVFVVSIGEKNVNKYDKYQFKHIARKKNKPNLSPRR